MLRMFKLVAPFTASRRVAPRFLSSATASSSDSAAKVVITAVGADRVGIVSDLTQRILDNEGNVEDSAMARLAGSFATVILVSLPPIRVPALRDSVTKINGLTSTVLEATPAEPVRRKFRNVEMKGADNPGLLKTVTSYFSERGINIERMETWCEDAPFGGTTLFNMKALVGIPTDGSDAQIQSDMQKIEQQLGVDITIHKL